MQERALAGNCSKMFLFDFPFDILCSFFISSKFPGQRKKKFCTKFFFSKSEGNFFWKACNTWFQRLNKAFGDFVVRYVLNIWLNKMYTIYHNQ